MTKYWQCQGTLYSKYISEVNDDDVKRNVNFRNQKVL